MQSDAYLNFESSVEELKSLIHLLMPTGVRQSFSKLQRRVRRKLGKQSSIDLGKAMSDFGDDVEDYIRGRQILQNRLSVMLVAITESYVEEGLVSLATRDESLPINIDGVSPKAILDAESLDVLKTDVRRQWASKFLTGGPRQWLPSLRKLGAKGYEKDCDFRLQHLWDTRNIVVHSRGIVRPDYAKRYPSPPLKVGDPIKVGFSVFKWWLHGLENFVEVTDQMFVKRVSTGSGSRARTK